MKSERVKLTPARAMLLVMFAEMKKFGEFASIFAAEKLIYFLQQFGARDYFKIDFKPYHYGPYSGGKVAHVLYALNGSYIKGMGSMDSGPFDYIWLTGDAEKSATEFIENSQNSEQIISICNKTKSFLAGFYSNYSLELLSSVHFLLVNSPSLANWRFEEEEKVLNTITDEMRLWSKRKEQIFKKEYLELAYRYFKANNL